MKNSAFILDFNLLKEQGISAEEFLTLVYFGKSIDYKYLDDLNIKSLQDKLFIKINIETNEIILREKGKLLIEFTSIEGINSIKNSKIIKKSFRQINELITNEFVNDFRNKWKGLKPGSMGSFSNCKEKLNRWLSENPIYSSEQILNAADIYIKSLDNYTYLQQADYFIYKKDGKEEQSRLSAFIDEIQTKSEGWTSNIK